MADFQSQVPRIVDLADQLTEDIRSRDLQPGDRYLSTLDASKMLGVGTAVTNRALQLLEKRQVIVRQQRKGSFIAHQPHVNRPSVPLRRVHLLVHHRYFRTEGTANDGVLVGMQGELPGASASISFLPVDSETEFVDSLIAESLTSKQRDAFVLIRASLETQRHIAASGLPAVVYGAVYPSISGISSIERDGFGMGKLLAEYLLEQGRQRIIYLTRESVRTGDYVTADGILSTISAAGLRPSDFVLRSLPADEASAEHAISELLRGNSDSIGVICRHERLANGAARAFTEHRANENVRSAVVICDYYLKSGQKPKYVYPEPLLTPEQQGKRIGQLLACQARKQSIEQESELIPVKLFYPKDAPPRI